MDKLVKAKWIEALRSGDYEQTAGVLTDVSVLGEERHCCLGVLCQVAIKNGVALEVIRREDARPVMYDDAVAALPEAVLAWAGLDDPDPRIGENDASGWNDVEGKTFTEIADLIDAHL